MQIDINIDELRGFSLMAANAASKMEEANNLINQIVSNHNWTCVERSTIDGRLEGIKRNSMQLSNAFLDYSNGITVVANDYSDFINYEDRADAVYIDELTSLMSNTLFRNEGNIFSFGDSTRRTVADLEKSSMDVCNILSLRGVSHGINVVDFSLFIND